MTPTMNDRRKGLAKTIAAEEKTLAVISQQRAAASTVLDQSQKTLSKVRQEVQDAKDQFTAAERAFTNLVEAASQQLGKINRLKAEMSASAPGETQ